METLSVNQLDASAIMGSTVLEFFRRIIKPSGCCSWDFMCIFRILNPVDPLVEVSKLYLDSHSEVCTYN